MSLSLVSRTLFTASLVIVLCLAGCVDYEEEMWLNRDLSGHAVIKLSVREELVKGKTGIERDISEEAIRKDIERIPGVKLTSFKSFRDSGKLIDHFQIHFDSVEKLGRYETKISAAGGASLLGTFQVQRSSTKTTFVRSVPVIPQLHGSTTAKDLMLHGMSSLFLGRNYLNYKLHLPADIINANSPRIDGKSRVVEWRYTLAQAVREAPDMRAEWKNFPFTSVLATALFVLALIAAAIYWWSRKTNLSSCPLC